MPSQETYEPPPLDDILKTLSQYSSTPLSTPLSTPTQSQDILTQQTTDPRTRPRSHMSQRGATQLVPQAPKVDPSSITTWPQALKYVISNLSQNATVSSRIKTLIHSQHQHEKQWWAGRQNLLMRLEGRDEGQKKANDLLRSLGADGSNLTKHADPDLIKKELEVYDGKVYRALSEMARAMDGELRSLGVPFFAIKRELLDSQAGEPSNSTAKGLGKTELLDLQRKMLRLLQDLFGD